MKKDENLETQETVVEETVETVEEAAETVEAEAVEEGEMEVLDEKDEKIAQLEQQAADNLDKYQRTLAEFDNFRKRTVKEKASMYDDGVRSTVEKLLMVIDNLERAVMVQEGKVDENDAFFKGVKMTLTQFQDVLKGIGVEEIKAVGEKFDPNLHAAVAHEDDENYGENEVVLEMLKGYMYKDKVIRHSMVKVAN
ncbi:nucleotide exchange factor GrpE [Anaerotignum sp.]